MNLHKPIPLRYYDVMSEKHHFVIRWTANNGETFKYRLTTTSEFLSTYTVDYLVDYISTRFKVWARHEGVSKLSAHELARSVKKDLRPLVIDWKTSQYIDSPKKMVSVNSSHAGVAWSSQISYDSDIAFSASNPEEGTVFDHILDHVKNAQVVYHDADEETDVATQAWQLPGVNASVKYPCACPLTGNLYSVIIHLNDEHYWTREQVADWTDKLHDEGIVNTEFSPWDELKTEEKQTVAEAEKILEEENT